MKEKERKKSISRISNAFMLEIYEIQDQINK